ncbi:MAG: DUF4292 domain-containing protein [Myxococcales bacterium]|nr:DUF4292 domain-containing protein [Myxococcales bacterium]
MRWVGWALSVMAMGCPVSPPRYPITDPEMVLRGLAARDQRVEQIRAHGSADHYGERGRIRGEVFVFVGRPSHVRVDTRAFGTTVSQIVSDGRRFTMADLRGGQFYTGPAESCVAAQLLGIPLEAAEVVAVLAGGPPIYRENPRIRWDDGRYVVDVSASGGRSETLYLELSDAERERAMPADQHPRPVRAVLRDARGVRAELTFDDYVDVEATAFPRRVRVVMARDNVDLQVRYREVSLDPELPDDVFSTEAPPNLPEVQVDCGEHALRPAEGVSGAADGGGVGADAGAGADAAR